MTAPTYPVPRNWRRVTRGRTRRGDKAWWKPCIIGQRGRWRVVREKGWHGEAGWQCGSPVSDFWCIIRRVTAAKRGRE